MGVKEMGIVDIEVDIHRDARKRRFTVTLQW